LERADREPLSGRLSPTEAGELAEARHPDPFAVLGPHAVAGGMMIRALVPGAERLEARSDAGELIASFEPGAAAGVFEAMVPGRAPPLAYRLCAENAGGAWTFDDPYRFGPVLGPLDDHLLVEGSHRQLYRRLGAHLATHEGAPGVAFAVWAPNARRVSVVGDFNAWDGRRNVMRKRIDSGIWEMFVPGLGEGAVYKYEIAGADGALLPLKADPFGLGSEFRPSTASVVTAPLPQPRRHASGGDPRRRPISALEVHLGSWRRGLLGRFLTYEEIADRLVPYAMEMGFTHLELMPVSEHPLDDSWGYQPIGLFAPTRRFGEPAGFARLIARAHDAGLGVILDWVPAHFPVDPHGLARFDGTALYEQADPRLGFHPEWNTAIFDFGRREVASILLASALYWLEVFGIDGLRVDAVSSMLYLDYARKPGEWLPNAQGGNENRAAEAFLRTLNAEVHRLVPGALTIAEESTAWPGVSRPAADGGLGFDFKWNMGWMHDTLSYMSREPVHRRLHHDEITFGLMYAFAESFVLPLSHDEVVHGKGTLLGRMPGDSWTRFAGLRAYYGLMWGYPGKKLLFMGQEFGQQREWDFASELDWGLLDDPRHRGVQACVRDLNRLYRDTPALHARDCEPEGFAWSVVDDRDQSVFAWIRYGAPGDPPIAVFCNFTSVPRPDYRIGLPCPGLWREVFNSDAETYGGSGMGNLGEIRAEEIPSHGFPASVAIIAPPMSSVFFRYEPDAG
jgi:1,4-alpha-glucan branching enzyme